MSGNLAVLPVWQFVDQNGHPIAGGSVAWYQAGTQNKVTIYSDLALDTPLPNPVPLDAAGRPTTPSGPTPIFFDPSRAYKQILLDANGTVIWTADNIVSPGTGNTGPQGPPGPGAVNANYTEGEWTPIVASLVDGSSGTGTTYADQRGHWTRIGRLVFITGRLVLSAVGTWINDPILMLAGLPFPVSVSPPNPPFDDLDVGAVVMTLFGELSNTDYRSLYGTAEGIPSGFALMGMWAPYNLIEWLHASNFTNTTHFSFTGFYQTAAAEGPDQNTGTEQVVIGDGADVIPLNPGYLLHLVNCGNQFPIQFGLVTMGAPGPRPGERMIIFALGPGIVETLPGDVTKDTSFVNEVVSGPTSIKQGVMEYVFAQPYGAWRLLSHRQNFPIPTIFDAADYASRLPQNVWTVTAANILVQQFELTGTRVRLWLEIASSTFTGFGGDLLVHRNVWGGYQALVPTQNAGLVSILDGTYDTTNGWSADALCTGQANVWDADHLVITNISRPFHGPILNLNFNVEFQII